MKIYYKIEGNYLITTEDLLSIDNTWSEGFFEDDIYTPKELSDAIDNRKNFYNNIEKVEEFKSYLNSTDFYYARKLETGEEVPADVVAKRIEAREFIRANE